MNTCSLFSPIFWTHRIASSFYNLKLKQLLGFCSIRRRIRNSSPSCFNNHNHHLLLFPDLILPDFYSKLRFFLFVFSKSASARFLPGIHQAVSPSSHRHSAQHSTAPFFISFFLSTRSSITLLLLLFWAFRWNIQDWETGELGNWERND